MYHFETAHAQMIDYLQCDDEIQFVDFTNWSLLDLAYVLGVDVVDTFDPEEYDFGYLYSPHALYRSHNTCMCSYSVESPELQCSRLCGMHNYPCQMTTLGHC